MASLAVVSSPTLRAPHFFYNQLWLSPTILTWIISMVVTRTGQLRGGLSETPSWAKCGRKEDWFPRTPLSVMSVNQNNRTRHFPMSPTPAHEKWRRGGHLGSSLELVIGGGGTTVVDSSPLVHSSHSHDRNQGERVSQLCVGNLFNDHPV